jgi:microcystin-dependent protein
VGWVRFRYDYDRFDLLNGGRRGYHLHSLPGRGPVPHGGGSLSFAAARGGSTVVDPLPIHAHLLYGSARDEGGRASERRLLPSPVLRLALD